MAKPIKCTYKDCFRRFDTVAAMKKHKTKDDAHDFYCKKCDEDCTDDIKYLLHQILSPKHICCPLCGDEFKSESGRDRHVNVEHPAKQNISCPGCQARFDSAAGLMGHIEQNKCKLISCDDFRKHQAEQQIVKDAIAEFGDPYSGATVLTSGSSDIGIGGGVSLLDNERVSTNPVDWEGNIIDNSEVSNSSPEVNRGMVGYEATDDLDRYPALVAATRSISISESQKSLDPDLDLIDVNQPPQVRQPAPPPKPWTNINMPIRNKLQSSKSSVANASESSDRDDASTNLLGSSIHPASHWHSFQEQNAVKTAPGHSTRDWADAEDWSESQAISTVSANASSSNRNTDTNAHIQVQPRLRLPSLVNLEKCWSPIEQKYVCPGPRCGKRLGSQKQFEDHLLTGVHVGSTVQCPSCLKRFKTTMALMTHIESGSIRCRVREAADIDLVLREVTAGMIGVKGPGEDGRLQYQSLPVDQW